MDTDDMPDAPDLGLGLDEMQIGTLAGDLRDVMLTRFRAQPKAWPQMSQEEQQDCAASFELAAKDTIRSAVQLLTAFDFPRVVATIGDVKIIPGEKRRLEAKVTAANIADYRDALGEHAGTEVIILMVDSETFMGERAPARTDPDQPDLPMGEGEERDQHGDEADAIEQGDEEAADAALSAEMRELREEGLGGAPATEPDPPPSEDEIVAAMKRARRIIDKGEAVIPRASYLVTRLSISAPVAEAVFARLVGLGLLKAPLPKPTADPGIAQEAEAFSQAADAAFEMSEEERQGQRSRQALHEREAAE